MKQLQYCSRRTETAAGKSCNQRKSRFLHTVLVRGAQFPGVLLTLDGCGHKTHDSLLCTIMWCSHKIKQTAHDRHKGAWNKTKAQCTDSKATSRRTREERGVCCLDVFSKKIKLQHLRPPFLMCTSSTTKCSIKRTSLSWLSNIYYVLRNFSQQFWNPFSDTLTEQNMNCNQGISPTEQVTILNIRQKQKGTWAEYPHFSPRGVHS